MARPARNRPRKARQPAATSNTPNEKPMAVEADSPLDWMLRVMNDESADPRRRDRMARAAAQYVHARAAEPGKKASRAENAKTANAQWMADLAERGGRPKQ